MSPDKLHPADTVVVIGGGIAGIQASLDLANSGSKVVLVERESSIGGKMAALDKNFPTLDCSICIEAPRISEAVQHDNIRVMTLSEVKDVVGHPGDFTVTIEERARYVTDACTRCGDCAEACPQVRPNEFDYGLGARKAIYKPFEQAEPGAYRIDVDSCLNSPPNTLPCDRCTEACAVGAIDFSMKAVTTHTVRAASVLVTTGFDIFDPRLIPEYGYGRNPDVLTSMEFERLLNAAGPTKGEILRPSDGEHPHKALFVLCVGSRDQRFAHYCSRTCCMYSLKEALQAKDHGVEDVTVLYMDIRAYGKGFDEFYQRAKDAGIRFVRGRPSQVQDADGKMRVRYEDTEAGRLQEEDFDMVVLASAMLPSRGTPQLAEAVGVELDGDGFLATSDVRGLDQTSRKGIYVAGCASGPKDIPDTVAEASGAAASALGHVTHRGWPQAEAVDPVPTDGEARTGVFVCDCGSNIKGTVDVPDVVGRIAGEVEYAEEVMFACAANTTDHIAETVKEKGLNRVVVAACSPKTHNPTFQESCARAGLNPYLFEMANIRNHGSWVHKKEPEAATRKAMDLLRMAVEKAKRLEPLEKRPQKVVERALVLGGGVAGMSAATALAQQGYETHLVEKEHHLGGTIRRLHKISGLGISGHDYVDRKEEELARTGVHLHLATEVETASGHVGHFDVALRNGKRLEVGAIVIATGAGPLTPKVLGHGKDPRVMTNLELESRDGTVDGDKVTFLGCVGSRDGEKGCSRYCCQSMMQNALDLRRQGKRVRIVSKDIRTYNRHAEELYEEAAREGVRFFRIGDEAPAEEQVWWNDDGLVLDDTLTGTRLALPTDHLVLMAGFEPPGKGPVAEQLKLSGGQDGYLLESHPKLGPVEAAVQGVFLAGTVQGPKDLREAVAQGLGAAAKATMLLSKGFVDKEPLTARIDPDKCVGCTLCAQVCPFNAIEGDKKVAHKVIEAACEGCGTCAGSCPQDAITMPSFTDDQILAQIDAATAEGAEEKVVVFACNWCSYAGADQAGIAKFQYPASSRIIRTMCSGRVSEKFVTRALERGAGAVLVSGCHPGDCHYLTANYQTEKRFQRWAKKWAMQGGDPKRLDLEWFSAAEGRQFAEKMHELDARIRKGTEVTE